MIYMTQLKLQNGKVTVANLGDLYVHAHTRGFRGKRLMHRLGKLTSQYCKFREMTTGVRPDTKATIRTAHFYGLCSLMMAPDSPFIKSSPIPCCPLTGQPIEEM